MSRYKNWDIDPFNSDAQTYIRVKSAYYSGTWDDQIAPLTENFPADAPTRTFIDLPLAVDVSDILSTRPVSIYDVTSSGALTRTTGAPGSGEYRIVTEVSSKARQKMEIHSDEHGHTLGFDYYGLGGVLSEDDVNSLIKGVTTVVISSSNSSSKAQTNSDYIIDTTDDAGAKINTIATTMTDGGTIQLLEGTYNVKTIITLANYVNLIGSGYKTLLQKAANIANVINLSSTIGNILRDFIVDGAKATYTGTNYHNIVGQLSSSNRFENIDSQNADDYGFLSCAFLDGCSAQNNTVNGFADCRYITNSFAYLNGYNGFFLCHNITTSYALSNTLSGFTDCINVSSCKSNSNTQSGFDGVTTISSCSAETNTEYGFISCHQITSCSASNNTIDGFYASNQISASYSYSNTENGFDTCNRISACYSYDNTGNGFFNCDNVSGSFSNGNTIDGFDSCDYVACCNSYQNVIGYDGCKRVTSSYAQLNSTYGFTGCNNIGHNYSISNTTENYSTTCFASGASNATYLVADTANGGFNQSS